MVLRNRSTIEEDGREGRKRGGGRWSLVRQPLTKFDTSPDASHCLSRAVSVSQRAFRAFREVKGIHYGLMEDINIAGLLYSSKTETLYKF